MQALTFHTTQFDIIDRDGQPWLRGMQVASALGYRNPGADIQNLYNRNADEFSPGMTALVEMDTAGGKQQVRIFSPRGVHLLAMLSRTKVAKEFRHWVLDVLEGVAEAPTKRPVKALPGGLSAEQQASIKALVKARVEALPPSEQAKAAITLWSSLKSKFGCTYKAIAPAQFSEAVSLVARLPLHGELLAAVAPQPALTLHYPVNWLAEHNPHLRSALGDNRLHLAVRALCGMDNRSATLALLGELTRAGHNVDACRLEVQAMRHHLERYWDLCRLLQTSGDNGLNAAVSITLTPR